MSIYLGSRYQTATIDMITLTDGSSAVVAFRGGSPLAPPQSFNSYVVGPGDTLYGLSFRFYGREDYYWLIADYNPGISLTPLVPGTTLRVPNVSG